MWTSATMKNFHYQLLFWYLYIIIAVPNNLVSDLKSNNTNNAHLTIYTQKHLFSLSLSVFLNDCNDCDTSGTEVFITNQCFQVVLFTCILFVDNEH